MKAVIIVPFRDKFTPSIVHRVGEVVDFTPDRVEGLAARNLVKIIEELPVEEVANDSTEVNADAETKAEGVVEDKESQEVKPKASRKGKKAKAEENAEAE